MESEKTINKNIVISLSVDELNIILNSLSELPFKDVYTLIGKLNQQANSQIKK